MHVNKQQWQIFIHVSQHPFSTKTTTAVMVSISFVFRYKRVFLPRAGLTLSCHARDANHFNILSGRIGLRIREVSINVYNSMGVASPKIREALKFVQRFTQKS